jgi:putative methionine-R-sulfoxide reductase with GAF domain
VNVQPYAGALEAVDRILNREPEADEVLRQTVAVVENRIVHYVWVGIFFAERGTLVLGPASGEHDAGAATMDVPVVYDGQQVALLQVATTEPGSDDDERAFLERVALLVSAHCLVGWDTGGEPWPDAS